MVSAVEFLTMLERSCSLIVVNPFPAASSTAELIGTLNQQLTLLAIAVVLVVEGILLYAVWTFRANTDPKPTENHHRLEAAWLIVTIVLLGVVGITSGNALTDSALTGANDDEPGADDVTVGVEAETFEFTFTYADEDVQTTDELVLPANRTAYLTVTSTDVVHSFHAPDLGIKQMAVPNERNTIQTTPTETGEYNGYCAEYCGHGHSQMRFTVTIVDEGEFERWLAEQRSGTPGGDR